MKSFPQLLQHQIEASGMKLSAIAAAAHITYGYLHCLLTKKRHPSEQVVLSLAEALRLSSEQTGELLVAAGYAPPATLLQSSASVEEKGRLSTIKGDQSTSIAQRCYRLAQEIPEGLQAPFLEEMGLLFEYVRYKYVLSGGAVLSDLRSSIHTPNIDEGHLPLPDISSLNLIATLVGELHGESEAESPAQRESNPQTSSLIGDMLAHIDQLTGSVLAGEVSIVSYHPHLVEEVVDVLRQGAPWEIRRRITEALPGIGRFDARGACQIMERLRWDHDETYGVDIRRRVVETLVPLFEADRSSLPTILALLHPQAGDDFYVALATMEVCGDLQARVKSQEKQRGNETIGDRSLVSLLPPEQAEVSKIQRQLLVAWEAIERESLQFSAALYDLLCAPEAALISVREGLQSSEKYMQLVAARYLERLLPIKPLETLQLYQLMLRQDTSRNVRRAVGHAFPALLRCLQETSLPTRTLTRSIILALATDKDLHTRRFVADYAMQLFNIDREFLLIVLRHLCRDRDPVIRHRLRPIALRLAQVWLLWYAETAGLVHVSKRGHHQDPPFFGEQPMP